MSLPKGTNQQAGVVEEQEVPVHQQWECTNIVIGGKDLAVGLTAAGKLGWEPWAIIGRTERGTIVAFKRRKSLIQLATELPSGGGLISS